MKFYTRKDGDYIYMLKVERKKYVYVITSYKFKKQFVVYSDVVQCKTIKGLAETIIQILYKERED